MKRNLKKLLALLLSATLSLSLMSIGALAAGGTDVSTPSTDPSTAATVTIASVTSPDAITQPVGTEEGDLGLPATVTGSYADSEGDHTVDNVTATWSCTSEGGYTAAKAGTYTFTATLTAPEGYVLATGLTATVNVTLVEATPVTPTYVAQIGTGESATQYTTLKAAFDAAVAAKVDVTITLLTNCTMDDTCIEYSGKTITLDGGENHYTATLTNAGFNLRAGGNLTLTGCTMNTSGSLTISEGAGYYLFRLSSTSVLKLDGATLTGTDVNLTSGFKDGFMYAYGGAQFILNNSTFSLSGVGFTAMMNEAGLAYVVMNDSHFTIDGNGKMNTGYNGMTRFGVKATGSTINIVNTPYQGMTYCRLELDDSTAVFDQNRFAFVGYQLTVANGSTLTTTNSSLDAVWMRASADPTVYGDGSFTVDADSAYTATDCGALRAANPAGSPADVRGVVHVSAAKASVNFADGADVHITGNPISAISNMGTVTLGSGTVITGNSGVYGGGVCNMTKDAVLNLSSGAALYNNHATTAGDDIYNVEGGTLNLVRTSAMSGTKILTDDSRSITGWFQDGYRTDETVEDGVDTTRWNVKSTNDSNRDNYIHEQTVLTGVTALTAIKAAHGIVTDPVYPAEPTPTPVTPVNPTPTPTTPVTPTPTPTAIPEPTVPTTEAPTTEPTSIPETTVPTTQTPGGTEIVDENTPLGQLPQTGDEAVSTIGMLSLVALLSVCGLCGLAISFRKDNRKDDEER